MTRQTTFEEVRKAQEILADTFEKTTRTQLASVEKLLELNRKSLAEAGDFSNPAEFFSRQASAFKEYAEQVNKQFEELAGIGNESREQLTELSQEFARNLDFSSLFNFESAPARGKKTTAKAA
ncbi:MAG: phasin family protein [Wenzhouxiangellaceae bacterium]